MCVCVCIGVSQVCPLSMLLFSLFINSLPINVKKKMQGLQLGSRDARTTAIAYTEDITIIATRPEDIDIIQEALHD